MEKAEFSVPYSRPASLSDPRHDWIGADLHEVLRIPDADMTWKQYRCIFQVGLPAAAYEEGVYFLPFAFEYLRNDPTEGIECLTDVVWFVSEHAPKLEQDGVLEACRCAIHACFDEWTRDFVIHDRDRKGAPTCAFARNVEVVKDLLDALVCYESLADLADSLLQSLAGGQDNPIKSAWFLTIANEILESKAVSCGKGAIGAIEHYNEILQNTPVREHLISEGLDPDVLCPLLQMLKANKDIFKSLGEQKQAHDRENIVSLISDRKLISYHAKQIRKARLNDETSEYWGILFKKMRIE